MGVTGRIKAALNSLDSFVRGAVERRHEPQLCGLFKNADVKFEPKFATVNYISPELSTGKLADTESQNLYFELEPPLPGRCTNSKLNRMGTGCMLNSGGEFIKHFLSN